MGKTLSQAAYHRNPILTALVCLTVLALLGVVAVNVDRLPVIGNGVTRHAHFSESSGLTTDAEVRVAGVKVGEVTEVELEGDYVDVSYTAGDAWLGDRTTAAIKIGNLLGGKFLALDPIGRREMGTSEPIPRNRTTSLYDVVNAVQDLSGTVGQIDTGQLAHSFRTMSDTVRGTSEETRSTLQGLSALSKSISARDEQLRHLLGNTNKVASVTQSHNREFERLLADGNILLNEVRQRRETVHSLLVGTRKLSSELTGLVDENTTELASTLGSLDRVTAMLARNERNLDRSLQNAAPLYRLLSNSLGNGRWADVYICGLLPPSVGPTNPQGCTP